MGVFTTQGYRGKLVDKLTGTILDQFADEDIKVSNNILQLFDLGEIPGTYTQQITLPGTKKNNAFFEQYYDISVWEPDIFNTNQVVEAYLDFDAFYLVNGYLQLNKVNVVENKFVDSYEVTLFGIISNFSIDTRATFLTDLSSSLSVYNHTASYANIVASWNNGLFSGDIVYPMAEYGQKVYYSVIDFDGIDDNTSALVVQDYKPAIRIKKVWDACFNEFGYTYTGSFWNEPFLNDVYMPLNNSLRAPVFNPSIEKFGQGKVSNVSGSAPISLTAATSASFVFNSVAYNNDNKFAIGGGYTKYTVDQKTTLDMVLDLAFKVTHTGGAGSGMPAWYIVWVKDSDGTVQDTQVLAGPINTYITTIRDSRTTTTTETYNLKGVPVISATLPTGTYRIYIRYEVYGTANFSVQLNPDASNLCQLEIKRVRQAGDQQVIDIPSNMPFGTSGIKVIDFIRSIQKKFNLVIYPDKLNPNQFVVETFNNWYKQGQIKDFNRYINVKDKIEFTPANQLGYNKVRFSDADDTDYVETLFKRTNNRVYGESNFYDSGSYYSQGTLEVISDVIASGPLGQVPGSVYTGSVASQATTCTTYKFTWEGGRGGSTIFYTTCAGAPATASVNNTFLPTAIVCARTGQYTTNSPFIDIDILGDCTPIPIGSAATGSGYPMWIPYYIADAEYTPARVLPRLLFNNGLVNVSPYWIQGYTDSTKSTIISNRQTKYPYFDNYSTGSLNGTSSIYPELDSKSLLYNNEQAVWGTTPTASLVTEYWDKYLALLYNPRTRLVDATAVIPLADYFDLELNDIAEFRGNYYHLRAINEYNLTTGECAIQMLGPIISDTISSILNPEVLPTGSCTFNYTVLSSGDANEFTITSENYGVDTIFVTGSNVYLGGEFYCYNGIAANDLVKISQGGYYDSTFNTTIGTSGSASSHIDIILKQPVTNKIIIGGRFVNWNGEQTGTNQGSLIRLNADGTWDKTFNNAVYTASFFATGSNEFFSPRTVAAFSNGNLVISTAGDGTGPPYPIETIYKVDTNGNFLYAYSSSNQAYGQQVAIQSDSKVIEADWAFFANAGGEGKPYRYTFSGSIDNTFVAEAWMPPYQGYGMVIQPDDKIVLVGDISGYYSGSATNGIVRLNSNGSKDLTFNPPSYITESGLGRAVSLQSDGKILYATNTSLYRLTNSGSVDLTYNVQTGSSGIVFRSIYDISQLENGNVMAVGTAFNYGVTPRNGFVQVYNTVGNVISRTSSLSC